MIYVVTHKNISFRLTDGYVRLGVGNHPEIVSEYQDHNGDNISHKNPSFCELTGLYWIWKNHNSDPCVGLVHYRRLFAYHIRERIDKLIPLNLRVMKYKRAKKLLKKYDIILPKPFCFPITVKEQYANCHHGKDMDTVRAIIHEKYPEYIPAFDTVMSSNTLHGFNMFITSQKIMDGYCTWLFDILFEAERRIDISGYDEYQKRIFGFLSERLLNVYCAHHQLNAYCYDVCMIRPRKWQSKKAKA